MSLIIQVRVVVEDDELVVDALKKEIKNKKIISAVCNTYVYIYTIAPKGIGHPLAYMYKYI